MKPTFRTNAEIMEEVNDRAAGRLAAIRDDSTRTGAWKRAEIAKIWLDMQSKRDDLVIARDGARRAYQRGLEATVFSAGTPGDPSWAMSRRDAAARLASVDNPREAMDLLKGADRANDEPMARAIAERAYEYRWLDVANEFLDSRPHLNEPFSDLWNQTEPTETAAFIEELYLHSGKPIELDGLHDSQIQQLALADRVDA